MTVEVYTLSLNEKTKLKGLLGVVSSSAEFENILIRWHEDSLLRRMYDRVPVKLDQVNFEAPHFKTFLLLQAHFSPARSMGFPCWVTRAMSLYHRTIPLRFC